MAGDIIILEGCDKTGKTTLARALARMLGWPVVAFKQPKTTPPVDEYFRAALQPGRFIFDRFHLGQLVYGPVYRGERDRRERFRLLELLLRARGAVLVYLRHCVPELIQRFRRDREDFAKEGDVSRLLTLYEGVYTWSCLPCRSFALSTVQDIPDAVKQVVRMLENQAALPEDLWRWWDMVGNLGAAAVLVGDQRNLKERADDRWRRVPFHSLAGDYLLAALEEANLLDDVLLVNSLSTDRRAFDFRAFVALGEARKARAGVEGFPRVVPLGQAAEARLGRNGMRSATRTVPHPQWWRRFRYKELGEYARVLRRAVHGQEGG